MRPSALIDSGALVALLDHKDRWHPPCVAAFRSFRLPLATSLAVLAEFFHLLGPHRRDVARAWNLIADAVTVPTITDSELPDLAALMERYGDRPMDFADATLVHLARRESLTTIFTIDHDDFETYRIDGRRRFQIVPARRP